MQVFVRWRVSLHNGEVDEVGAVREPTKNGANTTEKLYHRLKGNLSKSHFLSFFLSGLFASFHVELVIFPTYSIL